MHNLYFTASDLAVLLNLRRWRLAGPPFADTAMAMVPRHRRWMRAHQHAHPYPEVMVALAGQTVYGADGRLYPCRPGSVFVFEPDRAHDMGYPPWTPAIRHLRISFIQDKVMSRITVVRAGPIYAVGNLSCLLDIDDTALWRRASPPTGEPGFPLQFIRLRWLAALAGLVAALVAEGYRKPRDDCRDAVQREKIDAICRQILETGGAGANLDHLAQIAGYSKFHFLRLFRRHTGQTIHAYVNQSRRRAVEKLRARGMAFKEISAELGFSCTAAFSRWHRPYRT